MITENSWVETKAEIDRVMQQAKADRARVLRTAAISFTTSIKRLFGARTEKSAA